MNKPCASAQLVGPNTKEHAIGSLEERAWLRYYQDYSKYKATPDLLLLIKFQVQEELRLKKC